uniref:C2 domain-containing protein n=1 Tax=Plectus sambesii TaxID=2011161 RepID=A0A914VNN7_9BILA
MGIEDRFYSNRGASGYSPTTLLVGGVTLFVLVAMVAIFAYRRKNRLNWYDRNLLEIAESSPQYVRCKPKRMDTFEEESVVDEDEEQEESDVVSTRYQSHGSLVPISRGRKQSRIISVALPTSQPAVKVQQSVPEGDLTGIFTVPRAHNQSSSMFRNPNESQFDRGLYELRQDSTASCEEPVGQCGSLKLAIHLDVNLNLLTVVLKQAADLQTPRQDGPPNPYCRVTLGLPEPGAHQQTQQSRIYKKTRSPEMNDEFFFDVPNGQLNQCKLEVLVYDFDQFSVDECVGYCWLTLGRLEISTLAEAPTIFWAEVLPVQDPDGEGFGEILFSLTYLSKAQRLTVNIFKARNLSADEAIEQPVTAIRVSLLSNSEKRLKRKKTSSKKNTLNPTFNESLTFSVPKNTLCDVILEFEAIHEYGTFGMGSKVLGKLELPIHTCKELWRAIIREEKTQARWYPLEKP